MESEPRVVEHCVGRNARAARCDFLSAIANESRHGIENCFGQNQGGKQGLGVVTLPSRLRQSHERVTPEGENILFLLEAVAQSPQLGAVWSDQEVQTVAIT